MKKMYIICLYVAFEPPASTGFQSNPIKLVAIFYLVRTIVTFTCQEFNFPLSTGNSIYCFTYYFYKKFFAGNLAEFAGNLADTFTKKKQPFQEIVKN